MIQNTVVPTLHNVRRENRTERPHSWCGQNVKYMNVKQVVHITATLLHKATENLMEDIPLRIAQLTKNGKFFSHLQKMCLAEQSTFFSH